ncbi:MAG: oligosaccharide flippase family protein [Pseudoclavibacter sp.]
MSVTQARAPGGARLLMLAQVAKAGTLLLGVIVLSRLLEPMEFGIVAVAIALVGIAEILRDFGLPSAAMTYPAPSKGLRDFLGEPRGRCRALCDRNPVLGRDRGALR